MRLELVSNCEKCLWGGKCEKNECCDEFTPIDEETCRECVEYMRGQALMNCGKDDIKSFEYDFGYDIDEILQDIREGQIVYIEQIEKVYDIMLFENDVNVEWQNGYYIGL